MTVNIKITVIWNVKPFSLIDRYQRFGGTCCLFISTMQVERASVSENLVLSTKLRGVMFQKTVMLRDGQIQYKVCAVTPETSTHE
jgi:hypothetical protein